MHDAGKVSGTGLDGIGAGGDRTIEVKSAGVYRALFHAGSLAGVGQESQGSKLVLTRS